MKRKSLRERKTILRKKVMYKEIFSELTTEHMNIMAFGIIIFALTKGEITSVHELNAYQALWQHRELGA